MQTSTSGHPAEEELMAFADGDAPAEVVAHVEACSTCSEEARSLARMQAELRHSLYRFDCPDAHSLGEYQLDLLRPEQRTRLARHVVDCDACSVELQTLRGYLATPTAMPESRLERTRRMIATLFQPEVWLAYGGLRGSTESTLRVFQVEDVTVTVDRGQESGTLVGLVLLAGTDPQTLAGRGVRLLPPGRAAFTATLDDLGNFEFEDVSPGQYALEVEVPRAVVVVEALRLD